MNAELEALVLALEAVIEGKASGDTKQLEANYESRLHEALARHPGVSRAALVEIVDRTHRRWLNANKKFSSIPPKA